MWPLVTAGIAAAALAGGPPSYTPSNPPEICAGDFWSDQIGTSGDDELVAQARPQRLWGLAGADRLTGSAGRASCLFGGRGNDVLDVSTGGGVAFGEAGADRLIGGPPADTLDGGAGVDGVEAGGGDDKVDARDGTPELIDCGPGQDLVEADRADVLFGCEEAVTGGRAARSFPVRPHTAGRRQLVRITFRVPKAARAGAYRVILTSGPRHPGCVAGPRELTRLPEPGHRVRARQKVRVGLRPPAGRWCPGVERAVVVLYRAAALPGEPIARLRWHVRG